MRRTEEPMTNLYTAAAVLAAFSVSQLDAKIERLEQECGEAGDLDAVKICRRALAGSQRARRVCARWIADAAAASL
jgi:hypothetical protein